MWNIFKKDVMKKNKSISIEKRAHMADCKSEKAS